MSFVSSQFYVTIATNNHGMDIIIRKSCLLAVLGFNCLIWTFKPEILTQRSEKIWRAYKFNSHPYLTDHVLKKCFSEVMKILWRKLTLFNQNAPFLTIMPPFVDVFQILASCKSKKHEFLLHKIVHFSFVFYVYDIDCEYCTVEHSNYN